MSVMVDFDYDAIEEMLNTPEGETGRFLAGVGLEATALTKSLAPVMQRRNWSHWGKMFDPRYQYGAAGITKYKTHWSGFRFNGAGQMYTGVNTPYGPTLFLERPARQIFSRRYAFMSEALDTISI